MKDTTLPTNFEFMEFLKAGWELFTSKIEAWLKILGLIFLLSILPQAVLSGIAAQDTGAGGLLGLVFSFWSIFVQLAAIKMAIDVTRGIEPSFEKFLEVKDRYWTFLFGSLAYSLRVMLGFLLLIVPGIIWAIQFMFVPSLIADKKLTIGEAFPMSKEMTNGRKTQLFIFWILFVVMNAIAVMLFVFPVIVTSIVTYMAYILIYRYLLAEVEKK